MAANHIAKITRQINAPATRVWKALTTPNLIEKYFFGTRASSEWKEGSDITFEGTWEDQPYTDKGTIQVMLPEKILQYSYFSPLSGLDDVPENYQSITFELDEEGDTTLLTLKHANLPSEEEKIKSENNWNKILNDLKQLVENMQHESYEP